VAKDASDMVLTDDNFATIVAAVREGRGIFTNLKTVVYYLLSCNASEVLVMFVGFLAFGFLGDPLLAVQLLWINLITDGLPALALGVDPPASDVMDRPPARRRSILPVRRQVYLLSLGTILAAGAIGALVLGHYAFGWEWETVRTFVFTALVVAQLAHVYPMRSRDDPRFFSGPGRNRLLGLGVAGSLILQFAVVYLGVGQTLFDTAPLPVAAWPVMLAIAAATFTLVSLANRRRIRAIRSA
jgi:Ca2+-transporting ATPase